MEELQRIAMGMRFKEHYESIEMLRTLADCLGVTELKEFNDVVPLFFAHTAFKSYPASLLDGKRIDLMTRWLNKLTSYDLSTVDVSDCNSIDEWIECLDEQTPLETITSSGTTGTISLIPKSKKGALYNMFTSVKHVTQFIQPGLELISLDPKRSATIIGPEAFASEQTLEEVASRLACDIGVANQEACASARVVYVLCGTDAAGMANINRLGDLTYQKLMGLPEYITSKPKTFNRELAEHLDATRMDDTFYRIVGGEDLEGAIIVSQFDEPVDYSSMLSGRVANLVPVDSIEKVTAAVTALTQTVGIYPESLKEQLRDQLPLFGAQRMTSLGYACSPATAMPQDAIEPLRRMCKWIVEETCDPAKVYPLWGE